MAKRSFKDLADNLVNARKVMGAVESGSYRQGNINPDFLVNESQATNTSPKHEKLHTKNPVSDQKVDLERIKKSNLPDNIKQLMIENPIEQVNPMANDLPSDFINEVSKKMSEQNQYGPGAQQRPQNFSQNNANFNPPDLKRIIKESVKEVLDEMLGDTIQNLNESKNIKENLAIKVGDTLFTGKITKVKKT